MSYFGLFGLDFLLYILFFFNLKVFAYTCINHNGVYVQVKFVAL